MRIQARNPAITDLFDSEGEPRPRNFHARIRRRSRARAVGARRHRRRTGRFAALAAAIAVPAVAAPGDWRSEQDRSAPVAAPRDIAIEQLAYAPASEEFAATIQRDGEKPPMPALQPEPGPAARALMATGSATDRVRAQQCLAMAIYYEAASEREAGQQAVAQVVLNRVAHPAYPNSVCGVVFQGSERSTGCQFTFTCDGSLARKPSRQGWERASRVARAALAGAVYPPVGLATHYHTTAIHPYWADSLRAVGTIGAHRFYRWPGAAGTRVAFNAVYRGAEPEARPNRRQPGATARQDDPIELARAYEARQLPLDGRSAATASAAAYAEGGGDQLNKSEALPLAGTVLPAYERSGQWLARP